MSKTLQNSPVSREDEAIRLRFSDACSSKIIDPGRKSTRFEESLSRNSSTTYSSPQKVKRNTNVDYLFTVSSDSLSVLCDEIEGSQNSPEGKQFVDRNVEGEHSVKKRMPRVSQYRCPQTTTINLDLKRTKKRRKGRNNYQTIEPAWMKIDLHTSEVKPSKFSNEVTSDVSSPNTISLKSWIEGKEAEISSLNKVLDQSYRRVALLYELLNREEKVTAELNSKMADLLMGSM